MSEILKESKEQDQNIIEYVTVKIREDKFEKYDADERGYYELPSNWF